MGKDFIPLGYNHIDKEEAIKKLYKKKFVTSASKIEYFNRLPNKNNISEIEIGSSGTKESIFRLKNGNFIEVNRTLQINKLKKVS
jgi:hypothetical protein